MIIVDKTETSAKQHRLLGEKLLLPPGILIHSDTQSVQQFSNNYYTKVLWWLLNRIVTDSVVMVARRIKVRSTGQCSSIDCSVARENQSVAKA